MERASCEGRFRRMPKLKVFRTPAGFHDAYVAAPSQKAALKAWGSDADLFARGIAERVTDPELMEEPLSKPGVIVKVSRGSAGDHFKVAEAERPSHRGRTKGRQASTGERAETKTTAAAPKPKRKSPRPSRAQLEAADHAVDQANTDLREGLADIDAKKRALDEERRALRAESAKLVAKLEAARDRARKDYQARLERWSRR